MVPRSLILLTLAATSGAAAPLRWFAYDGHGAIRQASESDPTRVSFVDETLLDGWGKLYVHADASRQGAHAAGFVEGYLTFAHIYQHYVSWVDAQFGGEPPYPAVVDFVVKNDAWVRQMIAAHQGGGIWQGMDRLMAQVDGLLAGQNAAAGSTTSMKLSRHDMLLLMASGDIYDIIPAVRPPERVSWGSLSLAEFIQRAHARTSCSSLTTFKDGAVRAGHTTWTSYLNMLRIYKHTTWTSGGQIVHQVGFSARPGYVYSKDDFYTLPVQNMVVMETTNNIFNNSLYELVKPESLLIWQRLPVVNFLAKNGAEWVRLIDTFNSGTYNNQWIVLTLDKATAHGLDDGFLFISEQIPGEMVAHDVTSVVRELGYWPSFNVPYDAHIFNISGYAEFEKKHGDAVSYARNPRAKIFRRDAPSARESREALQKVLRSNNFQRDPFSLGDATNAISARGDLDKNVSLFGGVDTKVMEYQVAGEAGWTGGAWAQSGPTHDQQPPFSWEDFPVAPLHLGQPTVFNFPFVRVGFPNDSVSRDGKVLFV